MPPQLKELRDDKEESPFVIPTTPVTLKSPIVLEKTFSVGETSPSSSVKSTASSSSPRGMGKRRPSLVFDVDDLELCMALQEESPSFIKKMNGSHPDTVKAYSMAFGNHPRCLKETDTAVLTGLDRDGFLLDVTLKTLNGNKEMAAILKDVRVPYQGKVKSAEDLHVEATRMYCQACDKLGFLYKAKHGYFQKVAKKGLVETYKGAKANPMTASAVAVGVVALVGGITLAMKSMKKK